MDINLLKIQLSFAAADSDKVATAINNASCFESHLKGLLCRYPGQVCNSCRLYQQCSFTILCGRQLSTDTEITRLHQKPGLPYIFNRLSPDSYPAPSLELLLLGSGINLADELLGIFHKNVEMPDLTGISVAGYQQEPVPATIARPLRDQDLSVLSVKTLLDIWSPEFINCNRLDMTIITPLRLLHQGRELSVFTPELIVKGCLRRISALAAYYGEPIQQDQLGRVFEAARGIKLASGNPIRSKQRGILGKFNLSGDFSELGPLLKLGGMFHVGKGASYGMGSFEVSVAN